MSQLCIMSSLCSLKKSYYQFQGHDTRNEQHQNAVAAEVDYLLSSVEKYLFTTSQMNFFSKFRLVPVVGLSIGFIFDVDQFI